MSWIFSIICFSLLIPSYHQIMGFLSKLQVGSKTVLVGGGNQTSELWFSLISITKGQIVHLNKIKMIQDDPPNNQRLTSFILLREKKKKNWSSDNISCDTGDDVSCDCTNSKSWLALMEENSYIHTANQQELITVLMVATLQRSCYYLWETRTTNL